MLIGDLLEPDIDELWPLMNVMKATMEPAAAIPAARRPAASPVGLVVDRMGERLPQPRMTAHDEDATGSRHT